MSRGSTPGSGVGELEAGVGGRRGSMGGALGGGSSGDAVKDIRRGVGSMLQKMDTKVRVW